MSSGYYGLISMNKELDLKTNGSALNVVLVQPPNIDGVSPLLSMGALGGKQGWKPPLGLLYVATYLKEKTKHGVTVIDGQVYKQTIQSCAADIVAQKPDVVGISAWTDWWYSSYELSKEIKKALPDVHISIGGPHTTIFPAETLSMPEVDSVVVGDGEVPFAALCNMLGDDAVCNDMPGLHFAEFGYRSGKDSIHIQKDLDALAIPDRTLLDHTVYTSLLAKNTFCTTIITSRGCPNKCVFCRLNFQQTVSRSAENILIELEAICALGIEEIEFYDDTFTRSKQRVKDLCHGIIERNLKISWAIRDRVKNADPELLELMKRAGCTRIHYGVESGSEKILKSINKNITVDEVKRAIAMAKKYKYELLTFFMIGNLDETIEDVQMTFDLAKELNTDYALVSIAIPYPGTVFYQVSLDEKIIPYDTWKEFALNPVPNYKPHLYEKHMSLAEMSDLRDQFVKTTYMRPSYILKQILKVKSWGEFSRKGKMAIALFTNLAKSISKKLLSSK